MRAGGGGILVTRAERSARPAALRWAHRRRQRSGPSARANRTLGWLCGSPCARRSPGLSLRSTIAWARPGLGRAF